MTQSFDNQDKVLGVADRTKQWHEQKNQKLKELQEEKERQMQNANECTFKPQILTRKTKQSNQDETITVDRGYQKYMERMNKAQLKKEEQQILEEKLFKKGQNWKPKLTTPIEPRLSSYITKQADGPGIKALNKPVNPLQEHKKVSEKSQEEGQDSPQQDRLGLSPNQITKTQDFIRLAQRNKDQFVELRSDMNYEEAISLIHQHILNLDI